jgi:diguanylate cyclase (GGDEF)-like protein/PAS domain S-box-containing protein
MPFDGTDTGCPGDHADARMLAGPHAGAILDAALDAVVTVDHRGLVLEFNRAAESTFGYSKADVLGRELAELIVPEQFRDAHRRALARWTEADPGERRGTLLGKRVEVRAMRADGSEFPAELAISRVDLPGPPLFTACIRDLSDHKHAEAQLRAAEFQFRTLVEQLPLISYVDSAESPVSRPHYLSPQIEQVLGRTPEEWLSTPGLYERSIHPDDLEHVLAEKHDAYEREEPLRSEYRMIAADGRIVWVEDQSVQVQPPDGRPAFRQGFAIDVTDRKRAELDLQDAEARFRTLVEQLPLVVYVDAVDATSSNLYTSPQVEPLLGYSVDEWLSDPLLFVRILHPEDRERVLAAHARTHKTGEPLCLEYRLISLDGRVVWVHDEARIVETAGGAAPVLQGYLLDVTARVAAEEQLRHQAFHDPLTGLANRALLTDRAEHALERVDAEGRAAILFLDLDDFKAVNDRLGHPAGDALLCEVGARLRAKLAPSHTVARLGGDEFAILVEDVREPAAVAGLADRLVRALESPFDLDGHQLFVTASIGIAVGRDADELLRSADVAMYRAKAAGKAQYAFYVPTMDDEVLGRLELIADLRRASPEDFVLHYQPTVELATGRVVGIEALVRWAHPTRGLQAPAAFVAAAEETGLIVGIGQRVLEQACRQVAAWRIEVPGAAELQLSVNVSGRQLHDAGLADDVRRALMRSGLEPAALTLEITETVLADRRDDVAATLAEMDVLGVRLALDDFGTGYSSLALLRDLPVHSLKIDRSFVQGIESESDRAALLRAVVEIGRALDLTVVAEGIESAAQEAVLRRVGCPLGQGFHYARPLDDEALRGYLALRRAAGTPAAAHGEAA